MSELRYTDRQTVALRSLLVGLSGWFAVAMHWWTKDFRLRVVGDGSAAVRNCSETVLFTSPLEYLLSVRLLRVGFRFPFCAVIDVTGVRGWLIFQIFLWGLACICIYRAGALLFGEGAGLLAGFSTVALWETFRFAVRPQSDLLLLFAVALSLWTLARYQQAQTTRHEMGVLGAIVLVALVRPLGLPIVLGWTVWITLDRVNFDGYRPKLSMTGWALLIVVCLIALFVLPSFVLGQMNLALTDPSLSWREGYVAALANGIVVTHTTVPTFEYLYTPRPASSMLAWLVFNADHLLAMALFKWTFFFVPILTRWSTLHIVVNLFTLFPLILGTFAGFSMAITRRRTDLLGVLGVPILMSLLTLTLFYLDGGFNYRAPATLVFPLFTAYAVRQYIDLDTKLARLCAYVPL